MRKPFLIFLLLTGLGTGLARAGSVPVVEFDRVKGSKAIVKTSIPATTPVTARLTIYTRSPDGGVDLATQHGVLRISRGGSHAEVVFTLPDGPAVFRLHSASGATLGENNYFIWEPTEPERPRHHYETHFSFMTLANVSYINNARTGVYFDPPAAGVDVVSYGGKVGVELEFARHLGLSLKGGYERIYYSDIGIGQIKKNQFTAEMMAAYYFNPGVGWDPFFTLGPGFLFSASGYQARLLAGGGVRRFFTKRFFLRLEPHVVTDFKGIGGEFDAGVGWRF